MTQTLSECQSTAHNASFEILKQNWCIIHATIGLLSFLKHTYVRSVSKIVVICNKRKLMQWAPLALNFSAVLGSVTNERRSILHSVSTDFLTFLCLKLYFFHFLAVISKIYIQGIMIQGKKTWMSYYEEILGKMLEFYTGIFLKTAWFWVQKWALICARAQ